MKTQFLKLRPSMIAEQWRDSDGYWVALKDGFKSANDPVGVEHQIHENTKREAFAIGVMRCDCAECRGGAR